MNRTADRLGLESSSFRNPIGLDAPGHFSTAADLAKISRVVMEMTRFRKIAAERTAVLTSYRPPLEIETTNDFLLAYPWATGIKTGATQRAGYLLASAGERRGVELSAVVMGTDSESARDIESARLLDWGFAQYREELPLRRGDVAAEIPVRFRKSTLGAVPASTERVGLRRGQNLKVVLEVPAEVEGPIRRGVRLGRAMVVVEGDEIGSVPLLAAAAVPAPTLFQQARGYVGENLLLVGLAAFAILSAGFIMGRRRNRKTKEALRRIGRKRT
jgi:D-alanyl-D-alanine carboxypeptidase (penicillin-binding protein 5/6)